MPNRLWWALPLTLVLGACTKAPEPSRSAVSLPAVTPEATHLWQCAEHTALQWRYVDDSAEHIDLQVADNPTVQRLSKRPAGLHNTFSDGVLAFELQGTRARLYQVPSGKHVDYDCKAQ